MIPRYLTNWSPHTKLDGEISEERWFGRKIGLSHLGVFGCTAFVHVSAGEQSKLDARSRKMIFLRSVGESESFPFVLVESL